MVTVEIVVRVGRASQHCWAQRSRAERSGPAGSVLGKKRRRRGEASHAWQLWFAGSVGGWGAAKRVLEGVWLFCEMTGVVSEVVVVTSVLGWLGRWGQRSIDRRRSLFGVGGLAGLLDGRRLLLCHGVSTSCSRDAACAERRRTLFSGVFGGV